MRITILTIGSRGDVQPYVALGIGLQTAGHQVCLATETIYQEFVVSHGLSFAPLPGNSQARHAEVEWRSFLEATGDNIWRYIHQGVKQFVLPMLPDMMRDALYACQGCDVVMSMPQVPVSFHVAEKLGVPFYSVWTTAGAATREFPHPMLRLQRGMGGWLNQGTYRLIDGLYVSLIDPTMRRLRQETLQLPPRTTLSMEQLQNIPVLYAYSPTFLPKPSDWSEQIHVTGYWFLDPSAEWQPPQDLVQFLADGAPPIYVGFGSMTERDPDATTRLVLEAIARTQQRAVIASGWAGLGNVELPPHVFLLKTDVPFKWLFPKMAAIVHHGGSGTVAEGLRAGMPQVVIYQPLSDQFFLGKRLAKLGVGSLPLARKTLTVTQLTDAIETAITPTMQMRAAALARQVRLEPGVTGAVNAFHHHQRTAPDRDRLYEIPQPFFSKT
jgi:sterol 3beta-glucosyltransferase